MFRFPSQLPPDLARYAVPQQEEEEEELTPAPLAEPSRSQPAAAGEELTTLRHAVLLAAVWSGLQAQHLQTLIEGRRPSDAAAAARAQLPVMAAVSNEQVAFKTSPPAAAASGSPGKASALSPGSPDAGVRVVAQSSKLPSRPPSIFSSDEEGGAAKRDDEGEADEHQRKLPQLNPLDVPELREMVLAFVPVDFHFDSRLLRVSSGWYANLHPRLYKTVSLTGPKRRPLAFVKCLERMDVGRLDALGTTFLRLRVRDDDRAEDIVQRLLRQLARAPQFARAIKTLTVLLTMPDAPEDDLADAKQMADLVAALPGLSKVVFKEFMSAHFYADFWTRMLACHSPSVIKALEERLVLELPPEILLFRSVAAMPTPPQVKTIRTFFTAPSPNDCHCDLSVHLVSFVIRYMDGGRPEAKLLVLGPALKAWVDRRTCSHICRLEVALAQRIAHAKKLRVVFPKDLALGPLLDADPTFSELGLDSVIMLWESGVWPEVAAAPGSAAVAPIL